MRTRVYVDGFNFYVGAFTNGRGEPSVRAPYKWLDLQSFCRDRLPDYCDIDLIRYFTTPISLEPRNPKRLRQETYFAALTATGVEVRPDGKFKQTQKSARFYRPDEHTCGNFDRVEVTYREEKMADVNLATAMLVDCFTYRFDAAAVISDDTDLTAAIRAVYDRVRRPVFVITVRNRNDLFSGDMVEVIPAAKKKIYARNMLPWELQSPDGTTISCPEEWRPAPPPEEVEPDAA